MQISGKSIIIYKGIIKGDSEILPVLFQFDVEYYLVSFLVPDRLAELLDYIYPATPW